MASKSTCFFVALILVIIVNIINTETYHGNEKSKIFHKVGCKDYNCKNCVITFWSTNAAIKAGYHPHLNCVYRINNAQSKAVEPFTAQVISVADGDTITVQTADYEKIKIRLYGIDAPEMDQPGGKESRQYLYDRLYGKDVLIKAMDIDRYSRLVAIVYLPGAMAVNVDCLTSGHAWVYTKYCKVKMFCDLLPDLEAEARDRKDGLWAYPDPVPPWEWRKK